MTDDEIKELSPTFVNMPQDVDCFFSADMQLLNGKMNGYNRRVTFKGRTGDGGVYFSHNNSGWGRRSSESRFSPSEAIRVGGGRLIGINLRKTIKAGDFLSLPVGSIVRESITKQYWRIIRKDENKGFALSNCIDPTKWIDRVNPNLGIRRCLVRHNKFTITRGVSSWEEPDIMLPTCRADVTLAQTISGLLGGSQEGLREWLKASRYTFFAPSEEAPLAAVAYEAGSWDEFEGLCG